MTARTWTSRGRGASTQTVKGRFLSRPAVGGRDGWAASQLDPDGHHRLGSSSIDHPGPVRHAHHRCRQVAGDIHQAAPHALELREVDLDPVASGRRRPAAAAGLPDIVALAAAGERREGLAKQSGLLGLEGPTGQRVSDRTDRLDQVPHHSLDLGPASALAHGLELQDSPARRRWAGRLSRAVVRPGEQVGHPAVLGAGGERAAVGPPAGGPAAEAGQPVCSLG
jgi:hypothetical protein